jgi:hypothetical protein
MKRFMAVTMIMLLCQTLLLQDVAQLFAQKRDKYALAILNFVVNGEPYSQSEVFQVTARLTDELAQTGYFVTMSQTEMEYALRTTDVDSYDCASIACGLRAGKALGVQLVVIGTIVRHPSLYVISVEMLHLGSGVIVKSVDENIEGDKGAIIAAMPYIAQKLVGNETERPVAAAVTPRTSRATPVARDGNGGGFKWYYAGLGMLVAGGVGLLLLNGDSNNGTNTGGTPGGAGAPSLPGPPTFP